MSALVWLPVSLLLADRAAAGTMGFGIAGVVRAPAKREPAPELHVRADHSTDYGILLEIMTEAGKAGLGRIGFISDPSKVEDRHSAP